MSLQFDIKFRAALRFSRKDLHRKLVGGPCLKVFLKSTFLIKLTRESWLPKYQQGNCAQTSWKKLKTHF